MKLNLSILLLATALVAPTWAQEVSGPAPEMGQFTKALGTWSGKGSVRMGADGPEMPWTATATYTKVLDGHFIQEDMVVEVGAPAPLVFRTYHGWDPSKKRFHMFGIGNNGELTSNPSFWAPGGKLITAYASDSEGEVASVRTMVHFQGDRFTVNYDRAVGGGDFYNYVSGEFKRGGDAVDAMAYAGDAMAPPSPQMQKLGPMIGSWKMVGKVSPMPGAPMMEVTGSSHNKAILGGHAIFQDFTGDPVPEMGNFTYRAFAMQGWDPVEKRLIGCWISNMGELMTDEAYVMPNGAIVSVSAGYIKGSPMAQRGVTTPRDGGLDMVGWSMIGDGKPEATFHARMTRIKEETSF